MKIYGEERAGVAERVNQLESEVARLILIRRLHLTDSQIRELLAKIEGARIEEYLAENYRREEPLRQAFADLRRELLQGPDVGREVEEKAVRLNHQVRQFRKKYLARLIEIEKEIKKILTGAQLLVVENFESRRILTRDEPDTVLKSHREAKKLLTRAREIVSEHTFERKAERLLDRYVTELFSIYGEILPREEREEIKTVAVMARYINPEPLRELTRHVDAFAVTLKAFDEKFYREVVGGELKPVMMTLEILREERVWFEIITQIIPTLSDDLDNLRKMFHWIRWNLGSDVPLHLTRFFPAYRLTHLPPTPIRTMEEARELALSVGLKYVYLGNVPGHEANNTFCPGCGKAIVERVGFIVLRNHIERGRCKFCRRSIPGIWR